MADSRSDTSELLANESKEHLESPVSQRAYLAFDANSVDSNKTLIANQNNNNNIISNESVANESKSNHLNVNTNHFNSNNNNVNQSVSMIDWKEEERKHAIGIVPMNRPFFTLPRLLSSRRKRIKRKSIIPNESAVTRIEEHPETDSIGHLSTATTNTTYRNGPNIYVKENFFIRLMR